MVELRTFKDLFQGSDPGKAKTENGGSSGGEILEMCPGIWFQLTFAIRRRRRRQDQPPRAATSNHQLWKMPQRQLEPRPRRAARRVEGGQRGPCLDLCSTGTGHKGHGLTESEADTCLEKVPACARWGASSDTVPSLVEPTVLSRRQGVSGRDQNQCLDRGRAGDREARKKGNRGGRGS